MTHYQAALEIDDRVDLRLELASYLEEQAVPAAAYQQYLAALGKDRADAFVGARRTAPTVEALARDLLAGGYLTDVIDVLYGVPGCDAHCLRAEAFRAWASTTCSGRAERL